MTLEQKQIVSDISADSGEFLLQVDNLQKHFPVKGGFFAKLRGRKPEFVHAVDGVTFSIKRNETFAIVGESGSGKTTLGLSALRLIDPTSGKIFFDSHETEKLSEKDMRKLRRDMQIVFQDPSSSLDPHKRIVDSISEPLRAIGTKNKAEIRRSVAEALKAVGLDESQMNAFPHQFSGGQRQRISIARAIILKPKFIVLDEPTSSLDASVQSQILLLLQQLQEQYNLSYLLITHNISVARYLADRIAVMYLGRFVEIAKTEDIMTEPLHPYTQMLIASVLEPEVGAHLKQVEISGEIPSPINPPSGCRFHTRCPYAKQKCSEVQPEFRDLGNKHFVECHYAEEIALSRKNLLVEA